MTLGSTTFVTDSRGKFTLGNLNAQSRVVLKVDMPGYTEGLSVGTAISGVTTTLQTRLLPIASSTILNVALGGTITVADTSATVFFPPNAFTTTGTVSVQITPQNLAIDSAVMLGDYTAAAGSQFIETFGAMVVTVRDSSGNLIKLAPGISARIRIPAYSKGIGLDSSIGLYSVDYNSGSWTREGNATLGGVSPNQYYEGSVTHFSAWSASKTMTTIRYTGCARNVSGQPAANVQVTSDGVDYASYNRVYTSANGAYVINVKADAATVFSAVRDGAFSNSLLKTVGSTNTLNSTECLSLTPVGNSVKIQLAWGLLPGDIDSHLFTPAGDHIFYNSKGSLAVAPYANLDLDDTTSFGPEVVTINRLMTGIYTYGLHNFSNSVSRNTGFMSTSPVRVVLSFGGINRTFRLPVGETSSTNYITLFQLTVDANCNITVQPVNLWVANIPNTPRTATPVFCVP